jgi:hypothetical protein
MRSRYAEPSPVVSDSIGESSRGVLLPHLDSLCSPTRKERVTAGEEEEEESDEPERAHED